MTSKRKARSRLLRWNRWIAHYPPTIKATPACVRAYQAANRVEPYEGGWYDEPEDDGCCTIGVDEGHAGPCVWQCSTCYGHGRCEDCGGEDDLGCHECGGTGVCQECHGDGEVVDDWYVGPPARPIETLPVMGGVL